MEAWFNWLNVNDVWFVPMVYAIYNFVSSLWYNLYYKEKDIDVRGTMILLFVGGNVLCIFFIAGLPLVMFISATGLFCWLFIFLGKLASKKFKGIKISIGDSK